MSEIFDYLFLGALQGGTEFLPVSSSGHLTIFSRFLELPLGAESKAAFFAVLHLATFFAVLLFTYKDVWGILSGLAKPLERESSLKYVYLLGVGTVPAVLAGLLFEEGIKSLFSQVVFASLMLYVTAVFLFFCDTLSGGKKIVNLSLAGALLVGVFQAGAIVPGISRSGLTIFASLLVGLTRPEAVKFSFLLSLPVTFGAGVLGLSSVDLPPAVLALSALAAFGTGLIGLWLLKLLVLKGKLRFFSLYCIIVGTAGLIFQGVM